MSHDETTSVDAAQADKRQRRIVIALACLIAAVMVGLGLLSVVTGEHSGSTRRGAVFFEGSKAQWMGAVQIGLGMTVLALAMKTRVAAMKWMAFWFGCAALALVMALRSA